MRSRSDLPPVDPHPWTALIPLDSFSARLAEVRDLLVDDDLYRPLSKDSTNGHPITPIEARPAQEHAATPVVGIMERQHEHGGLQPGALFGDGTCGTADARADLGQRGSEVVAKLRPRSATTHLGTDQVTIELAANEGQGSGTCPQGETTSDVWMARAGTDRPVRLVRFPAATGGAWSPREGWLGGGAGRVPHPVRPPPGWQVHLHDQEAVLQEARAAQQTTEQRRALREQLRPRAKIERTSK